MLSKISISKRLVRDAVPFQKITDDTSVSLLVVGDSTGVGVGATRPEESVAGRLAEKMHATYVENISVSGATVKDLIGQECDAKLGHYNTILVMIGGNDIVRFHRPSKAAAVLGRVLDMLPTSDRVYVIAPGNVGAATLLPRCIRPIYTWINRRYQKMFASVCRKRNVSFINLYRAPEKDPFVLDPKKYLAEDEFHPSCAGYGLWFDGLLAQGDR